MDGPIANLLNKCRVHVAQIGSEFDKESKFIYIQDEIMLMHLSWFKFVLPPLVDILVSFGFGYDNV